MLEVGPFIRVHRCSQTLLVLILLQKHHVFLGCVYVLFYCDLPCPLKTPQTPTPVCGRIRHIKQQYNVWGASRRAGVHPEKTTMWNSPLGLLVSMCVLHISGVSMNAFIQNEI